MTDAQIIAISITVLAVLVGTMVNNSRIGDIKEVLRGEIKLASALTDNRFDKMDRKLDEILSILGQHNSRIEALEQRLPPR